MSMTNYERGAAFERRVLQTLSKLGWLGVKAGGSKGAGKLDILALAPDGTGLGIQCKCGKGGISGGEMQVFFDTCMRYGLICLEVKRDQRNHDLIINRVFGHDHHKKWIKAGYVLEDHAPADVSS